MAMKAKILEMIQARPGTSFAELMDIEGFEGDLSMVWEPKGASNIVLWSGVSRAAVDAINSLTSEKAIEMRPTNPLTYLIDGRSMSLPVAKQARHYKSPHWFPIAFYGVEGN